MLGRCGHWQDLNARGQAVVHAGAEADPCPQHSGGHLHQEGRDGAQGSCAEAGRTWRQLPHGRV